jgi:hypothetical protein
MNFRTTLILGVTLLVVACVVFFTGNNDDKKDKADIKSKLVDLEPGDVTKVVITPAQGQRTVFVRSEGATGDWRLAEPLSARAETFEVTDLVRKLTELQSRGQVQADQRASTGLDAPAFKIELTAKGGKSANISFGKSSPVADTVYVQVAGKGQPEIVTGGGLYEKLDRPASEYRSKRLVDVATTEVKQIAVERPGEPTLRLEKRGEKWQVVEPSPMPGDSGEVSNLVSAVTSMNAADFVTSGPGAAPASPALYGLVNPQMTVWISTTAPQAPTTGPSTAPSSPTTGPTTRPARTVLRFGRYDDLRKQNVYVAVADSSAGAASGSDLIAKVAARSMESLHKKPLDLRDREVVKIDPEKVSEFILTTHRPSTTQPTTKPAEDKELHIARRKEAVAMGPAAPTSSPGPTTGPATRPTTQVASAAGATTQPATSPAQPEKAPAKWVIVSQGGADADDAQVDELLRALNPLKTTKYLETAPTTQPAATYTLTVKTIGAGGVDVNAYSFRVTDPGTTGTPTGGYDALAFELDRTVLQKLEGDFKTPKPAMPEAPPFGGGFPGGGFPGGPGGRLPPGHP